MLMEALVIVVFFWVIKGLICVLRESKSTLGQASSNKTNEEILAKDKSRAEEYICDDPKILIMSKDFREEKLKEYPSLVHVGDKLFRCKSLQETYDIQRSTFDIYDHFVHKDENDICYSESCIRRLVYQYINSIGNDDFYDAFVELLMKNKDLLLAFIRECHVAESWREENNRLYDPENYMKDFIDDNKVAEKIHETNADIIIPSDFRHRRPVSPSEPIKAYIDTQKEIAENVIKISESAKSGIPKLRVMGFIGILAVVMTVVWFIAFYNNSSLSTVLFWIGIIIWLVFVFGGIFLSGDSDRAAYYQEKNIKTAGQKSNLDTLGIWAQDYERERNRKIEREKNERIGEIMHKSFKHRRTIEARNILNTGGNNNDRR